MKSNGRRNRGRNQRQKKKRDSHPLPPENSIKELTSSDPFPLPQTPYIRPLDDPDTMIPPLVFQSFYGQLDEEFGLEEFNVARADDAQAGSRGTTHTNLQARLFPFLAPRRNPRIPGAAVSNHLKASIYTSRNKF